MLEMLLSMTKGGLGYGGGVESAGGSGGRRLHQTELIRGYLASRQKLGFQSYCQFSNLRLKFSTTTTKIVEQWMTWG
jgi:hypothetical protein